MKQNCDECSDIDISSDCQQKAVVLSYCYQLAVKFCV